MESEHVWRLFGRRVALDESGHRRDRVYQALGYVSIALVLAACTTAYFYIRDLTGVRIPAAIAALCYGLSAFGIHRIAQVDNAYLTLVLLPAAMLAIRRIRAGILL